MSKRKVPHYTTVQRHAKALGMWEEYKRLREKYKLEGLKPKDAAARAYKELDIGAGYQELSRQRSISTIMGSAVTLTREEIKEAIPGYKAAGEPRGAAVGEEVLPLPEQIRWVKRELARVRNGGDRPKEFPNADVLYWYQTAVSRPVDFDKIVMKMEAPDKGSDDPWARDGEYQFRQIEGQIQEAMVEAGKELMVLEAGFVESLGGLLGAVGGGVPDSADPESIAVGL